MDSIGHRGKTKTEERLAENRPREKVSRQMGKRGGVGGWKREKRILNL